MSMRTRRWGVLAGVALAFLAGCGQGSSGTCVVASCGVATSSGHAASPSAATALSHQLIVIGDDTVANGGSLRLVRPDGNQVQQLTLKAGAEAVRAAGSRIFILEQDGGIKALHKDGSVEDLGNRGAGSSFGFVVSPDGHRWMWGTSDDSGHGQVHLAGDGLSPRVVTESHENAASIQPYSWTPAGAFLADSPIGIGGYIPFGPVGPVEKVDLTRFTASPVAQTSGCSFSDMATDGTIACFPHDSHSIRLIGPNGKVQTIQLAQPRFALFGDAYFSRDGSVVTVGGAVGSQDPEQYGTDLVTTKDGSINRLSVEGVRPAESMQAACWLDDGSLVVWRPRNGAGGSPGVFVVGTGGAARQVSQGGMPIGVLAN